MEKIVLGNWKAHLSPGKAVAWVAEFRAVYDPLPGLRVVLAVPDLCMEQVHAGLQGHDAVFLASQGVSPYPPGSYTGATPAVWLQGMATYVLAGHRERRRYFHESVQEVAAQVRECIGAGLQPVVCMDHAGAAAQVSALDGADIEQSIFAYTPESAGTLEQAQELPDIEKRVRFFADLTGNRPILYGGGVNRENAAAIMAVPGLAGIMLGRSCLDPGEFLEIARNCPSGRP